MGAEQSSSTASYLSAWSHSHSHHESDILAQHQEGAPWTYTLMKGYSLQNNQTPNISVLSSTVFTLALEPRSHLQSPMNGCPVRLKPEAYTEVNCCAGHHDPATTRAGWPRPQLYLSLSLLLALGPRAQNHDNKPATPGLSLVDAASWDLSIFCISWFIF